MKLTESKLLSLKILFEESTIQIDLDIVQNGGHPGDENFEAHEMYKRWKEVHDLLVEGGEQEWIMDVLGL